MQISLIGFDWLVPGTSQSVQLVKLTCFHVDNYLTKANYIKQYNQSVDVFYLIVFDMPNKVLNG